MKAEREEEEKAEEESESESEEPEESVTEELEEEVYTEEKDLLDLTKDVPAEPATQVKREMEVDTTANPEERIPGHKPSCKDVDIVTFWKDPLKSDVDWVSPFKAVGPKDKYITFEPDVGGWNNIRMQMETVLVMAAATGRTLVLPPDQPLYLLNKGKGHDNQHSFADFFPFEEIKHRVPVISMKDFMEREAIAGHLLKNPKSIPGQTIPNSTLPREFLDAPAGSVLYPPVYS